MDFSLVVPTYQRRDMVCDAVRSINAIEFAGRFELVVVVDGSTDGTAGALAELEGAVPVTILEQDNSGAATARNRGASHASGEFLLFLDDDMICQPDILSELTKAFSSPSADGQLPDAIFGHIPLDPASPHNLVSACVGAWAQQRDADLSAGAPLALGDLLSGQFSIRREVFSQLGGFDCDFTAAGTYGNEDLELGVRLLERHAVRYCPEAVSFQRYIVTPAENLQHCSDAGRADVLFAAKHPARAEEIFAQHGITSWKVRWLFRPLASVPLLPRLIGSIAARLSGWAYGTNPVMDRALIQLFAAAREIIYWQAVHRAGGRP